MKLRIEVKGLEQIQKRFAEMPRRLQRPVIEALVKECQGIIAEAQKLVPVVTGRLKSSAYVRTVSRNLFRTDLRAGYDAPYAVYVHEIPPRKGHVTKSDLRAGRNRGRGYKWLERAANVALKGAAKRLAEAISPVLTK